ARAQARERTAAGELYLIDGPSLAYRAFFALPESMATSTGVPTNAIFGFASMLVKIVTEHGIAPTLVAWDAGSSGRSELFADYKAGRRSRPDLLREQWPAMERIVEALGYANVLLDGYEADDVIATLAEQARLGKPPLRVTIVTGDRDAFQLIDEAGAVRVMATARGITDTTTYDRDAVIARYGIPPELIPDYYGLKGDSSDNIPGVPGIGEKTAGQLIARFGSLESVLEHVEEVSGEKRRQNLTEHRAAALLSKQLATVKRDLPIELEAERELTHAPDPTTVRAVFQEFELRAPLRRLEEAIAAGNGSPHSPTEAGAGHGAAPSAAGELAADAQPPVLVRRGTLGDLAQLARKADVLYVAMRAAGAAEGRLFADDAGWRFAAVADERAEALAGDCQRPEDVAEACDACAVVAHDAKALGRVPASLRHDTLLGAYLLDPARRGYPLDELSEGLARAQLRLARGAVGRRGRRVRWSRRGTPSQSASSPACRRRSSRSWAWTSSCATWSSRSCLCCATWSSPGCASTSRRSMQSGRGCELRSASWNVTCSSSPARSS
ncbi:MAG: 5'-3' exonuclease, partial [Solirubrobacteraceae bacterium]